MGAIFASFENFRAKLAPKKKKEKKKKKIQSRILTKLMVLWHSTLISANC